MSFSFGNTSQPAFGSTPTKPTGFGTPLAFGTPSSQAAPSFGGFGSSFGAAAQPQQQQQQQAPAFGSAFGAPAAAATAPSFGSSFGAPSQPQQPAPAFGSTFGTPATSASAFGSFGAQSSSAPSFGSSFGAPAASTANTSNLFGGAATTKPSLFGAPTASTPSLFSTPATNAPNLFGSAATTQPQTSTLFGAGTPATSNLFGTATSSAPSLFGSSFNTTTTSTPGLFGTNTSTLGNAPTGNTGFGLFGSTATTSTAAPSLFSGFGGTTTTTAAPGFSGFGATTPGFSGFGGSGTNTGSNLFGPKPTIATAPPVATAENKPQQTLASFYAINLFGDERDDIIKKWNMLQACWGTGKGYYSANQPAIEYDHCNPFFRFKTVGYIVLPNSDNADGYVKLLFHKKEAELNSRREVIINGIGGILGNKPNLTVRIEHIKAISDDDAEIMITVSEKGVTGTSRKIQSSDLTSFLNQPTQKQQLSNVGVYFIGPYMLPSKAQLQEYLKTPPPGIDVHMWQAAQADNPQPNKYLPTSMNGFTDLKTRVLCEEYETGIHRAFLVKVNNEINELKRKHAASIAQITEQKQKFLLLQHRVLRILVKQEVTRKVGLALQPEEEVLRSRFEMLHAHLAVPTQFRGQLNELLSSVKMMNVVDVIKSEQYKMEPRAQDDIKQFLKMEQNGIGHLISIINQDLQDLKTISDGMSQFMVKQ